MVSETSKHRERVIQYCQGNGLDLGSGGDPIVPSAIQVDLDQPYCPSLGANYPVQLRGKAESLYWFRDGVMDFVYSSHLIEDYNIAEQWHLLREWLRVVKSGGHLVIIAPERERWFQALQKGQLPNLAHQHELRVGELTRMTVKMGVEVLEDRLCSPDDYSLMFVARKK